MKNIFREDGAIVRKLIGYQFAAAVMGVLLSSAAAQVKLLNLGTSILSALFYCYFIYTAVWEAAAKDRLKVDGKRMAEDKSRGLKFALAANIPNLVLGFVAFTFYMIGHIVNSDAFKTIASISAILARFWQGMYNGIINYIVPLGLEGWTHVFSLLIYLAIIIPAFAVSAFAYHMGYNGKGVSFMEKKK